jgi:hypothetical protein
MLEVSHFREEIDPKAEQADYKDECDKADPKNQVVDHDRYNFFTAFLIVCFKKRAPRLFWSSRWNDKPSDLREKKTDPAQGQRHCAGSSIRLEIDCEVWNMRGSGF